MEDETTESEATTVTETVETEISAEAMKSIATEVVAGIEPTIEKKVSDLLAPIVEKLSAPEPAVNKNLNAGTPDQPGESPAFVHSDDVEKMSEPMIFAKQVKAELRGDFQTLKTLNEYSLELRTKAGYNNTGVSAEGGYLIAPPQFEGEIQRLLPKYGGLINEVQYVEVTGKEFLKKFLI